MRRSWKRTTGALRLRATACERKLTPLSVIEVPAAKPDTPPALVIVDEMSLTLLRGATVDFATELIGSSFRIVDNPQQKAGCGCGVSWEAVEAA